MEIHNGPENDGRDHGAPTRCALGRRHHWTQRSDRHIERLIEFFCGQTSEIREWCEIQGTAGGLAGGEHAHLGAARLEVVVPHRLLRIGEGHRQAMADELQIGALVGDADELPAPLVDDQAPRHLVVSAPVDVIGNLSLSQFTTLGYGTNTYKDWGNEPSVTVNPTNPNDV